MGQPDDSTGTPNPDLAQELGEVRTRLERLDDPTSLLAGLFAFAPVGFQVYRADGSCLLTNHAFRQMFGSEPPPEYNVLRDELAQQAGTLGLIHRAFAGEVVHLPAMWYDPRELRQVYVEQGNRVAIEATFFPLPDSAGRVSHVAIAFKDLTAEVVARESAEAERAHLQTVLDQLPVGVIIAEASTGRLVQGNAAVERIWSHPFLAAASIAEYARYRGFHSDGRPYGPDEWPLARAAAKGEVVAGEEIAIERGDGSRGVLRVSAAPIRDARGEVAAGVVVFDDITDERRAQEATRRLLELTTDLAAALSVEQVARVIVEHGTRALGATLGLVGLVSQDGSALDMAHVQGYPAAVVERLRRVELAARWPMTDAVRTREPVFIDAPASARDTYPGLVEVWRQTDTKSNASLPLLADGSVVGVLGLSFPKPDALDEPGRAFALALARQCAQAVHRALLRRAEQEARYAAERASAELRASRDQLAAVLRGVSDAVTARDPDGRLVFANEAAVHLLGYPSPDELLAEADGAVTSAWDILDEQGQPFPLERLPGRRAMRGEEAPEAVVRYRPRSGGEDRWSLVRAHPVRDAAGEVVLSITVTQDVTARKRAEERLRFLNDVGARLPASLDLEETLAAVAQIAVETLADWCAVYLLAPDGRTITHSQVRHRDPARVGQAQELQRRYPPAADEQSLLWQVVRSGQPRLLATVLEAVLERAARDSEHLALLRALGLTSALWLPLAARGRVLGALGLFTAESRRRLGADDQVLAEEVAIRASLAIDNAALFAAERAARAQAEEAVRTRDEFLSIASHELRNPVAGLSGTAQLLRRADRRGRLDPEQLHRYLERIERVAAHLAELTEDLLDVSRLRGGTLPLRQKLTDLAGLVQEAVGRAEARGTGHPFQVALARRPWPVLLDSDRVEQIITNLLDNAIKYSPRDGAVQVTLEPAGRGVLVSVADQGIGLPPGTQDSIFEPFGRAPNAAARNVPGLGLGLYICRRLAEQHGGRLWAESPGEGQGTVLRLWLPQAASLADDSLRA